MAGMLTEWKWKYKVLSKKGNGKEKLKVYASSSRPQQTVMAGIPHKNSTHQDLTKESGCESYGCYIARSSGYLGGVAPRVPYMGLRQEQKGKSRVIKFSNRPQNASSAYQSWSKTAGVRGKLENVWFGVAGRGGLGGLRDSSDAGSVGSAGSSGLLWTQRQRKSSGGTCRGIVGEGSSLRSGYATSSAGDNFATVIGEEERWKTTTMPGLALYQSDFTIQKFKMENLKHLRQLVKEKDFMTSIDLKDGYLHVPVAGRSQRFLQFRLRNKFYRFRALPFGLSTAPRIFTKVLRPVVQLCRERGIRLLVYLDDFIILGDSAEQCRRDTRFVLQLLERTWDG